ncbi:MAG TPA: aminotransferase class V-fold PLP-dependent enzyme [Microthrixaceae bacterium]|nr:aspartate aminotransferase family protein [Microthrixaceae bacterium]MCB9399891.1 aspartate aminotransferase family protein [Microthrixaceae bacterium]MCO5304708.1 aminotransferase class V-fold PLP-dependent enzyme [Microthrixaceae bacterium]HMX07193.1 aminotransferase class V-fold PLP-dependent enzyme [Microthrixaceae bacterium]HNE75783.1 aminotransferase class V-fold PLP-dependent enzyme [Microthrixaceae bacterium]
MSSDFPYAERFAVNRTFPAHGRDREDIIDELSQMAKEEDAFWETGQVSGTMYCGDHSHYDFLTRAFGLFAHVNVLQRDMCPSATRFEGEIIAMALDLFHADAIDDGDPVGLVTSGGTGSISHAVLAYRDHARATHGITRPNFVKPETGHPAFDKACHLFGVELRVAPVDPATTRVDVAAMAELIDDDTIAILGSAGNYPYGTIDDIEALSDLALSRGVGLHVDGCLGGFILPFGEELGVENIPVFDFRLPGVTTISADTHKYGYSVKGTSVCLFRDRAVRNSQYFFRTDWSGGKYCSPGMDGSRSGGLLAATWASMVSLGREGYRDYARQIFDTAEQMRQTVLGHPELRLMGQPTFVLSFTSDEFDIYLVNDFMRLRGWRFNGQQYPNAIHIAVTRPQTLPGVTDRFAADLAEAVVYAREATERGEAAASGAIYGGVAGGMTDEADEFIRMIMSDMMDTQQSLPPS